MECLSSVPDLLELQPSPFSNLKCLKINNDLPKRKSMYLTLPNPVRNYLLNSSPSATVIMEFPEEQPRKTRKKVHEEVKAKIAELEAQLEHLREEAVAKLERNKAKFEAMILMASSSMVNDFGAQLESLIESQRAEAEVWFTRDRYAGAECDFDEECKVL